MERFDEEWRSVVGYEGVYEVSSLGNVRRVGKSKLMKQHWQKGYARILVSKDNVKDTIFVHRWVAEAFLGIPEQRMFVNHINGVKDDNRVENLEWVTSAENEIHSRRVLGKTSNNINGNKFLTSLSDHQVMEIRALSGMFSRRVMAFKNGVSETTVNSAVNYETYKNIGQYNISDIASETIEEYWLAAQIAPSQGRTSTLPDPEDLEGEIWRDCIDYEGIYKVSNQGRVKGLKRNSILSPAITNTGRRRVVLCKENKTKQWYVDILVNNAFPEIATPVARYRTEA